MVDSFESLDDMMQVLRESMETADKHILPWQALIQPGEYFQQSTRIGFRIYGEILKDPEDFQRDEFTENYRLCKAYSVACLYGEMGDVHVSSIERIISKEEFKAAELRGWQ